MTNPEGEYTRPVFDAAAFSPFTPPSNDNSTSSSRGPQHARKKKSSIGTIVVASSLSVLVGLSIGLYAENQLSDGTLTPGITLVPVDSQITVQEAPEVSFKSPENTTTGQADTTGTYLPDIIDEAMQSVAYIEVIGGETTAAKDSADGEDPLSDLLPYGSGSGFLISDDGYLLTNAHVVEGVGKNGSINVYFEDGTRYEATLVGSAQDYDVAVLKISEQVIPSMVLGDSNTIRVGEPVIAIGAPLGLSGTVTTGIISSRNRPFIIGGEGNESIYDAIQTDAAVNPGNSGGPLLNNRGEVIGITSAIATLGGGDINGEPASGNIGLAFAVPINAAKRVAKDIIETGEAITPLLGVRLDVNPDGIGALLTKIEKDSGAEAALLKKDDIVTKINERLIIAPEDLIVAIREYAPNDTVTVTYLRDGVEYTTEATLQGDVSKK